MPLINQVKEMQAQGFSESEIAQKLQEQGFSPLEINQAIEQSKIKSAVGNNTLPELMQEEMQPSVMGSQQSPTAEQPPQPTEETETPEYVYPTPQAYPPYPQQYQEYQAYQPAAETITEISEQIVEEKLSQIKKEIGNISEFKLETERKVEDVDERLKKIESTIDRLQASILGKIGSYVENIDDIKNEMTMMQESFSKALNPLIEKSKEKQAEEKTQEKQQARQKKKSDGFEHYLRR